MANYYVVDTYDKVKKFKSLDDARQYATCLIRSEPKRFQNGVAWLRICTKYPGECIGIVYVSRGFTAFNPIVWRKVGELDEYVILPRGNVAKWF